MNRIWLVGLLLIAACAGKNTFDPSKPRTQLFPDGLYHHAVGIVAPDAKERNFSGIVKLSPAEITVVGLGPLNATIFRLKENRATGAVTTEVFHESFKKFESKLKEFYKTLRVLMLLKVNTPSEINSDGVRIQLFDYDENRIPGRFELEHPKFKVKVRITSYET